MKRVFVTVLVLMCIIGVSGEVYALPGLDIDAVVAYTMPTGDFSDNYKPGYGIGGDVFLSVPFLPLQLGGRVAYNYFEAEDVFDTGKTTMIEIIPSLRYSFGPPLSPIKVFGQLGVGMYKWSSEFEENIPFSVSTFKTENDGTDFGVCIGAGIRGKIPMGIGFVVMPLYHIVMTEDDNLTYVSFNIGVTF